MRYFRISFSLWWFVQYLVQYTFYQILLHLCKPEFFLHLTETPANPWVATFTFFFYFSGINIGDQKTEWKVKKVLSDKLDLDKDPFGSGRLFWKRIQIKAVEMFRF